MSAPRNGNLRTFFRAHKIGSLLPGPVTIVLSIQIVRSRSHQIRISNDPPIELPKPVVREFQHTNGSEFMTEN